MVRILKKLLEHPVTRGLDINDPETTSLRREVIRSNRFLWRVYDEWYRMIASSIPSGSGRVFELGSGAGFLPQYVPDVITSEVFPCPGVQLVLDAREMPFADQSLKAIAMVDVLHHIPDARAFLREARRCLRPGGQIVMIEPWVSTWSKAIYTRLHHEPFLPAVQDWNFEESGPLSGANGALPWIVFERDRGQFESEFRDLKIQTIRPFMPFRYLLSGGVSMRQLIPEATFTHWRKLESWLGSWPQHWSMFAFIQVSRV